MKLNGYRLDLWRMTDGRVIWKREAPHRFFILEGQSWVPLKKDVPAQLITEAVQLGDEDVLKIVVTNSCHQIIEEGSESGTKPQPPIIDLEGKPLIELFHSMPKGTKFVGIGDGKDEVARRSYRHSVK